jgi:hypothetical protein
VTKYVDFQRIMELANRFGAKAVIACGPWHGFSKDGGLFLMPVHDNKVYIGYVQRFEKWLQEEEKGKGLD